MEKFSSCWEACRKHDVDVVRRALEEGLVVDSRHGWLNDTLLHESARYGCREIVSLLLEYKADVNVQDNDGETPLHESARSGRKEIGSLLLANMAKVNVKDICGRTPLHFSAHFGRKEIVSMLLSKKADINIQDKGGKTPLHLSVLNGHTEIVSLLLENKADVNVKCEEGFSPIDYADNEQVVNVLLQHGAVRYKQGSTPTCWSQTSTRSVKVTVTPGVEDNKDRSASTSFSHTQTIEIKDEVTNTIRNDETTSDSAQIYENTDQHKIPGPQTISTLEHDEVWASGLAGCVKQAATDCLKDFPPISSKCQPIISTDVSTFQQPEAPVVNIQVTVNNKNEINILDTGS